MSTPRSSAAVAGLQITHIPFKGTPETIVESQRWPRGFHVHAGAVVGSFDPREPHARTGGQHFETFDRACLTCRPWLKRVVPGFVFDFWVGLLAPAKTPRAIVNKLNAEVAKALAQPDVKDRMAKLGAESVAMTPEQFDVYIKDEFATLGAVMKAAPK
jgi:hypothetical protein